MLTRFKAKRGRPPAVKLMPLTNRTARHIDLRTFDEALRKLLAGSSKLRLAAGSVGPDLLISGRLHEMNDNAGGATLQSCLLGLTLLHVETTEKLWLGVHRARKLIESSQTKQGSQVKVSRRKLDETIDLSGHFNDSDATAVASAAAKDMLGTALARHRPPHIVRFYPLRNRTSEHIDTRLILAQLESLVLRSGKVRVVASPEDAQDARDVRAEAARTASDATLPAAGQELGSTCVVTGRITSTSTADADSTMTQYVVAFEAVDADDNTKLWAMSKAINKIVQRAAPPAR